MTPQDITLLASMVSVTAQLIGLLTMILKSAPVQSTHPAGVALKKNLHLYTPGLACTVSA
jgi:hypothetical protein